MLILALDPAVRTGYAFGRTGGSEPLRSGAVRLKKPDEDLDVMLKNVACFLRDQVLTFAKPDLCVIEHWMSPQAQKSGQAVIYQLTLHGAIIAVLAPHGVRTERVHVGTWRKHFTGSGNAGERDATKLMTLRRAKQLAYLPHDCTDTDRADACGIWDYAAAHYGRATSANWTFFGAR